jgi:hypothetical protein
MGTAVTKIVPEKKLIGILSFAFQNLQGSGWTIDRTEAAPRTFLFVKDWKAVFLGPDSL